ncbi:MAG: hypothetical protein LBB82_03800 [Treponema sp.]|jgi:hypothetical protein|nr:hypothetical protein [Treponema sp.]
MKINAAAAVLLLTVPLSCASVREVKRSSGEALMYGMIYDGENMSVQGVTVYVDGKAAASSDVQGRFILVSKKRNRLAVRLEKNGYESIETEVRFDPMEALHFTLLNGSQLLGMAENAMEESRYADAEELCGRVLNLERDRIEALFLRSLALFRQRKADEAHYALEYLRSITGDRSYIQTLLSAIKNLQEKEVRQ